MTATPEQLIALNREIAALVRAGVPLEQGLQQVALDGPHGERALPSRLAARMQTGATLPEALAAEGDAVPPEYHAIVAAGLRSGRLPEALESVASLAESLQNLRREIRTSFIYPLVVLALAYGLFVGFVWKAVPELSQTYYFMRLSESRLLTVLESLHRTVGVWGPLIPAVVIAIVVARLVGRWVFGRSGTFGNWGRWMPGVAAIRQNYEQGRFCQLLAALLEQQTPLPEALELTAASLGDPRLQRSARRAAESLRAGRSLEESLRSGSGFSPLARWMLSAGGHDLPGMLRKSSNLLVARAQRQSDWMQVLAPVLAVIVVGGGAVLAYGLVVVGPMTEMLDRLMVEPFR